ncbi:YveK family protein [Sporosarcina sp. HYO08]|uniref:YveK family protein n=1 Tax=Sporosarcina sp. HYO08 TaxID=1759557 RepID=UPI000798F1B4|nr:Wzz/FepE/Etk N-terminal domain-containing protein [Sporosarcina sp. HYO08]KXH86878.1 capsular biosynthesis protein [Sporosarcina sp. HYO08]
MEETISLQDLLKTLKKRLVLIISAVILAVGVAAGVSFFLMTPIHQASTQILVNKTQNDPNQFNAQEIQTNLQLINTYNVIITSPAILTEVIERLDLDRSPNGLKSQITVNSAQNSQVVNLSVQDPNPYVAADIANTTAEVFQEKIQTLMNVDNVNILSPAVLAADPKPIKPDPYLNMAIAAVIGLMLGVGIAFLLEYLDTTVKTEQDIEELINLPILGIVSPIVEKDPATERKSARSRSRRGGSVRV